MATNYHLIPGLKEDVTEEDIRSAYRRLAKNFHPDHFGLRRVVSERDKTVDFFLRQCDKRPVAEKRFEVIVACRQDHLFHKLTSKICGCGLK